MAGTRSKMNWASRHGDRSAVTEHEHVGTDGFADIRDVRDLPNAIAERLGRLGSDRSPGGESHVSHDDIGARFGQAAEPGQG